MDCPVCRKRAANPRCGLQVFASVTCPICLEEKNPAVALPCGHLLCRDDYARLGGRLSDDAAPNHSPGTPVSSTDTAETRNVRAKRTEVSAPPRSTSQRVQVQPAGAWVLCQSQGGWKLWHANFQRDRDLFHFPADSKVVDDGAGGRGSCAAQKGTMTRGGSGR